MNLYLVRHGETDHNKQKRYQGMTDIKLNEHGKQQAKDTLKYFDFEFDKIFSSPLQRAFETAKILSGIQNSEIITDRRLQEISFGTYEGKEYRDVDDEFLRFFDKPEEYTAVNGAESFESLFKRVDDFLMEMMKNFGDTDMNILVTSHGAAIHAMILAVTNIELKDFWSIPIGNCSIVKLEYKCKNENMSKDLKNYTMQIIKN